MQNLVSVSDEIKAVVASCTGTPTAKLIALLNAAGIMKATDVAAAIGISDRAVRKAKSELQDRNSGSVGTTGPELQDRAELQDRNHSSENGTTVPNCASRVLDNNKLTSLEDSSVNEVSEVKIIRSVLPFRAPRSVSTEELDAKFEEFWKAFPKGRKQGKGAAKVLFRQIARGGHHTHKASADRLIEAARAYADSKPDPRYTPMPQTWLNGGRWDDDLDEAAAATAPAHVAKPSRIMEAIARRSAAMEATQ